MYVVLGVMGFLILLLASGVWPILLLMLFGSFGGVLWLLFRTVRQPKNIEPLPASHPIPRPAEQEPTEQDLQALAWSLLLQRVTLLVAADHPNARWIWESPDAGRRFQVGEPIFILLNRAGGHRRARVVIQNLQAVGLEYDPAPEQAAPMPDAANQDAQQDENKAENYELLAFEWVDAHSIDLDARCKEAAGQKLLELVLLAQELPVRESWPDICKELARIGLKNAKCCPEGIRIDLTQKFKQETAERESEHECVRE